MTIFLDASALAKVYVHEPGSDHVIDCVGRFPTVVSRLSEVEVASAISRQHIEGRLRETDYDTALALLQEDFQDWRVLEITPGITAGAVFLLRRHRFRAGDAIQLASAVNVKRELEGRVRMLSYDQRLNQAAQAEGLALL